MNDAWELQSGPDEQAEDFVTGGLVEHNQHHSPIVRERFRPEHLKSWPLEVYAYQGDQLVGAAIVGRS